MNLAQNDFLGTNGNDAEDSKVNISELGKQKACFKKNLNNFISFSEISDKKVMGNNNTNVKGLVIFCPISKTDSASKV